MMRIEGDEMKEGLLIRGVHVNGVTRYDSHIKIHEHEYEHELYPVCVSHTIPLYVLYVCMPR